MRICPSPSGKRSEDKCGNALAADRVAAGDLDMEVGQVAEMGVAEVAMGAAGVADDNQG